MVSEQAQSVIDQAKRRIAQGQYREAVDLLQPWLEEAPDDVSAWEALGAAYFSLENWAQAGKAARRAVGLSANSAAAWCNLGTVLRKQGKLDEAASAQRRALAVDRGYQRARAELAKIRRRARDARATHQRHAPGPSSSTECEGTDAPPVSRQLPDLQTPRSELLKATWVGILWGFGGLVIFLLVFGLPAGYFLGRTFAPGTIAAEAIGAVLLGMAGTIIAGSYRSGRARYLAERAKAVPRLQAARRAPRVLVDGVREVSIERRGPFLFAEPHDLWIMAFTPAAGLVLVLLERGSWVERAMAAVVDATPALSEWAQRVLKARTVGELSDLGLQTRVIPYHVCGTLICDHKGELRCPCPSLRGRTAAIGKDSEANDKEPGSLDHVGTMKWLSQKAERAGVSAPSVLPPGPKGLADTLGTAVATSLPVLGPILAFFVCLLVLGDLWRIRTFRKQTGVRGQPMTWRTWVIVLGALAGVASTALLFTCE